MIKTIRPWTFKAGTLCLHNACVLFQGEGELSRSERRRKKRRSRWGPQEASGSVEGATALPQVANVPPPAVLVNPQLGQPGVVVNPVFGGGAGQGFGIGEFSFRTDGVTDILAMEQT